MKKNIMKTFLSLVLAGTFASCDFLDIQPLDSYTEENIFADVALTEAYLTKIYTKPRTGWGEAALRFVCDESMNNFDWQSSYTLNRGEMTPDQFGGFSTWKDYYLNIKTCNVFFANVDKIEAEQEVKDRLVGEAAFLRAFFYADLVNRFGGVPIITRVFELDDPEMMVKRNTYEECIQFIVTELDNAANGLPLEWTGKDFGRATKGAALALKSRMLLYAASPLWNPSNDRQKWQDAADAAWALLDLKGSTYALDPDYRGLFLNPSSPEIIFQRLYSSEFGHWFDWQNTPNGWTGYSATCVLQGLVDAYEMQDGTMPDRSIYNTQDPWRNRDPRFYASVVCDGQNFRDRSVDFWINEDGVSGGSDSEYGRDYWNYSRSHYTIRKFMDESLVVPWVDKGGQPWIYIRLAEIYLNYAEAMFQLGDEETARTYVNLVRERARGGVAGIVPDVTASGDLLLEKIRNERRVELAFEEHRFYDVRRWKIAEITENVPAEGIIIVKKADGTKTYTIDKIQIRKFSKQHYLLPIPSSERQKNSLLEQNPYYEL